MNPEIETPKIPDKKEFKFNFNIGADPEFQITSGNHRIGAGEAIHALFSNDKKCKEKELGFDVPNFGNIGWDNHDCTGEFRPKPAQNPYELANNIEGLIKFLSEKANFFKISTLSYGDPLGGHIQLELESQQQKAITDKLQRRLAFMYIPLMLNDNMTVLKKRLSQNYGGFTDNRVEQRPNGKYTLEFRTPSAEWMTTKETTVATLAYVATVWNEIINHPENIEKHSACFFTDNAHAQNIQKLPLNNFLIFIEIMCAQAKSIIKTFEGYKIYKNEIDFIMNNKRIIDIKKKVNWDCITGWNIETKQTKTPNNKTLLSEKKTETLLKEKNTTFLKKFININFNLEQAEELAAISNELKRKFIAFNWIPKRAIMLQSADEIFEKVIIKDTKSKNYYIKTEMIKTTQDIEHFQQYINETSGTLGGQRPERIHCIIPNNLPLKDAVKQILTSIKDIESGKLKSTPYSQEEFLKTPRNYKGLNNLIKNKRFRYPTFEELTPVPTEIFEESSDPSAESIRPIFTRAQNEPQFTEITTPQTINMQNELNRIMIENIRNQGFIQNTQRRQITINEDEATF